MIQEDERDDVEYTLDTGALFETDEGEDDQRSADAGAETPDQGDPSEPPPLPDELTDAPQTDDGYVIAYEELVDLDVDTAYNRVRQTFDYEAPAQRLHAEGAEDIGIYHYVSQPGAYYSLRDLTDIGDDQVVLQIELQREQDRTRVQAAYHQAFGGTGRPEDHAPWPSDPEAFERNLTEQLEGALE
ncbi:hypothetical protein [Halorhodospira halophila]|uniref:hypothetical protein n=1 Tax=Halorhodospira halophila TaxID=1053 RepID=UPI00191173D6|nr:hypothetical protein [Halorhodospira halophila]MBK5944823.1 hypothetical protein [Halorhodospira halophila]